MSKSVIEPNKIYLAFFDDSLEAHEVEEYEEA